jgi:UDP-N-acetylmuramate dehydrogenase
MQTPASLQQAVQLAPLTTLGIGGEAKYLCTADTVEDVRACVHYAAVQQVPWFVLGGGSNILVSDQGFAGVVIKMSIPGIVTEQITDTTVTVKVGAGVDFDTLIEHTVTAGWWGLENLSAIPGTVGATPVQNVGAYGVEVANCISVVEVYDSVADELRYFTNEECGFGYRTSRFKSEPGRYVITAVTFTLSRHPAPQCEYPDLVRHMAGISSPSQRAIRTAIQTIRAEKFPDWHVVGTAGSFFKNPIVGSARARLLRSQYPELPSYFVGEGNVKFPLGYILDKICQCKGYRRGRVSLYEKQALVLVAERGATAREVEDFAAEIAHIVFSKTGIRIEREVTSV